MTTKPDTQQVHRLEDMVTEEVSLVDRAANRRKFLVVKSEGRTMAGAEVVQGSNGQLTAAGGAPQAAAPVAPSGTTKANTKLTADAQQALAACAEECLAQIEDLQKQIEGADVVETEEEMDAAPVCEALMTVAEACEDACYALTGMDPDGDAEEGESPPDAQAAPPGAPNEPGPPLSKRLAVAKAKRVLGHAEVAKGVTLIAKYGAKMKKERLSRFQQAMDLLSSVMGDVVPTMRDAVMEKAKGKKKPPVAPAAGATPAGPSAPNAPPPAMSPAAKAAQETITKLEAQIATLATRVQKSDAEMAAKRALVAPSNAAQVEGERVAKGDGFSWPMDMTRGVAQPGDDTYFGDK